MRERKCLLVPSEEWRRSQRAALEPTAHADGMLLGVQVKRTGTPGVGGGGFIGGPSK